MDYVSTLISNKPIGHIDYAIAAKALITDLAKLDHLQVKIAIQGDMAS